MAAKCWWIPAFETAAIFVPGHEGVLLYKEQGQASAISSGIEGDCGIKGGLKSEWVTPYQSPYGHNSLRMHGHGSLAHLVTPHRYV